MSFALRTISTILAGIGVASRLLAADPTPPATNNGLTLMSNQEFGVFWKEMQAQNMAKFPDQSWPKPPPEAIEAWKDLRFGMFIHWGPSSQVPCEISWSRGRKGGNKEVTVEAYDRLYTTFNPTKFDADA
jgi:Alpha-L-fucosidase